MKSVLCVIVSMFGLSFNFKSIFGTKDRKTILIEKKSEIEGVFSFSNYVWVSEFSFVVPPDHGNAFSFLALTSFGVSGFFFLRKVVIFNNLSLVFSYLIDLSMCIDYGRGRG